MTIQADTWCTVHYTTQDFSRFQLHQVSCIKDSEQKVIISDFFFLYFYLGASVKMDTLLGPISKYFYLISEFHRCPSPFFS